MIQQLVAAAIGPEAAQRALGLLLLEPALATPADSRASRAMVAMALDVCLFSDLLDRVPTGAAHVAGRASRGDRVRFDHGALRSIRFAEGPTGALPPGEGAFRRILEPLGYREAGLYPLPALGMTGRAYRHLDFPETVPQFFVSELHVERFSAAFGEAAAHVFGRSRDPLGNPARALLDRLAADGAAPIALAEAGLPELVAAFSRQHDAPRLADYEALLAESGEAAWIATEGNAFNHATDRIDDVAALAAAERAAGRPIKAEVEVSANGRIRQTAYAADRVTRHFGLGDGGRIAREVPGSFYEFITRDVDPATGKLDLGFDSGNATGIFKVTRAA